MSGAGRAVVLAVGENTRHEMELTDSDLQAADSQKTAMTEKLEEFGDLLSKYAKFAAILILVILTVYQFMYILIGSTEFISGTSLFTLIDNIQITIALLIVCVPEGLPLAVSMSMAFSIDRLIDDNLLIKNLEALETSGSVLDILTGKTQTLSTGKLKVEQVFTGMTMFRTDKPDLNIHLQRGIMEAIILNSDVQLDIMDDE
jgi:P-type E1-E2 ATPase